MILGLVLLGLIALIAVGVGLVSTGSSGHRKAVSTPVKDTIKSKPFTGTPKPGRSSPTDVKETIPDVGALFFGPRPTQHFCTASVVRSKTENLLITAGHCIVGTARGLTFAPGFYGTQAPYGRWKVTAVYATPKWITSRDPRQDYVFLKVAPKVINGKSENIQQVVGGNRLVIRAAHRLVLIVAYPNDMAPPKAGVQSEPDPYLCDTPTYSHDGFPAFRCSGFSSGTSGSPFIADYDPRTRTGEVIGLIGGLDDGGCTPAVSYSPVFSRVTLALLARSETDIAGDDIPHSHPHFHC